VSGSDRESDASPRAAGLRERLRRWRLDRIASPGFQRWATRHWLTRGRARRDAERLWDLVSGFVASQVLLACAELNVFETLRQEPQSADALALRHGIASARMATLCRAGAALGLLTRRKDGVYDLGDLGAAALGVPGLLEMIRHNAVVYRDLTDPVALLRGETAPELARVWSAVPGGDADPAEIIEGVDDGLYMVSFGGGQVDITNGKFVFSCTEGYRVRGGKVEEPVRGAMLIGNGPDALTRVTAVGNDMALDRGIGTCGKDGQWVPVGVGQPTIRLNAMTVGGTEA